MAGRGSIHVAALELVENLNIINIIIINIIIIIIMIMVISIDS